MAIDIQISRVGPPGKDGTATLPTGVEGQFLGYGPGGVPVAVDAPEGSGGLSPEDRIRVDAAIAAADELDAAVSAAAGSATTAAGSATAANSAAGSATASATAAAGSATTAGQRATAAGQSETEAKAARDAILNMQVASGEAGSGVSWNGTTLTVPRGDPGESVTILSFEPSDEAGYNAALAANAGNPRVLVVRYAT